MKFIIHKKTIYKLKISQHKYPFKISWCQLNLIIKIFKIITNNIIMFILFIKMILTKILINSLNNAQKIIIQIWIIKHMIY